MQLNYICLFYIISCFLSRFLYIVHHLVSPVPPALSGSEDVTVEETKDAMLLCSVWAYPQVTVTWLRDEQPLDLVAHGYSIYQDSREARLTITNIHREQHQGWYSCVARSTEFGERNKTFQLLVEGQRGESILICVIYKKRASHVPLNAFQKCLRPSNI